MSDCKSFKPEINKSSQILILGSMPGIKSLEMKQYYAHPQNRFWKLMAFLCNSDFDNISYNERIKIMLNNKFALWDVISSCKREGSLDSHIQNETPNDIGKLIKTYPNIKTICLNGNKAFSSFKKYFPDILNGKEINCYKMPSTSPANAGYDFEKLKKEWIKIL